MVTVAPSTGWPFTSVTLPTTMFCAAAGSARPERDERSENNQTELVAGASADHTAVVLIALLVFRRIRTGLLHRVQSDRFLVEVELAPERVRDMLDLVADHGAVLDSLDCEQEGDLTAVRMHLRVTPGCDRAVARARDRGARERRLRARQARSRPGGLGRS